MILDKLLIDNLSNVGSYFINKAGLTAAPKNIDEMYLFLSSIRDSIKNKDLNGILLGNIFFSFVTSLDVRDRNVTARIFEDIFSGLFNTQSTDTTQRNNPIVPNYIRELDTLCQNEDWKISTDLSGNKREKCDLTINTYNISLKTLKGQAYDIEDKITDKSENTEINVGSLSYRSLLKGILPDSQLKALKDRKGGLGSKSQMQKNVYTPIKKLNILDRFIHRLSLFLNYIYEDDLYIVLKSNYRISFYLIPRNKLA